MESRWKTLAKKLTGYRYVFLVAAVGVLLLLWPNSSSLSRSAAAGEGGEREEETRIAELLASIEGVGPARVLLSENGAVVVCPGAEDPAVCLRIVQAVRCYTGLGADDVRIFHTDPG